MFQNDSKDLDSNEEYSLYKKYFDNLDTEDDESLYKKKLYIYIKEQKAVVQQAAFFTVFSDKVCFL